jgi:hypothetical protein
MPFLAIHSINYHDLVDFQLCCGPDQSYLITHFLKLFFYLLKFMINLAEATKQLEKTLEGDPISRWSCLAEISSRKLLNQPIHYLYIITSFICHMRFMLPVFELVLIGYLHCLIFKYLWIAMVSTGRYCLHCLLLLMT